MKFQFCFLVAAAVSTTSLAQSLDRVEGLSGVFEDQASDNESTENRRPNESFECLYGSKKLKFHVTSQSPGLLTMTSMIDKTSSIIYRNNVFYGIGVKVLLTIGGKDRKILLRRFNDFERDVLVSSVNFRDKTLTCRFLE